MTDKALTTSERQEELARRLAAIREDDRWRECEPLDSAPGPVIEAEGRAYVHLCSNNYLGLAEHPLLAEAAAGAAKKWGSGAGAARLITGTTRDAVELERELADFKGAEASLLFSTGYLANIGLLQALFGPGDLLICDELNHASLIDAAKLCGAEVRVYPHADAQAAQEIFASASPETRKAIITDGVFSMDGDLAPLPQLSELAQDFDAWLIVDDAHGTGVVGPQGRGACAALDVGGEHVIQIVTLSKALGSQGGAVVGSQAVIDLVVNTARTFVFETALAPPAVAAARAGLKLVLEQGALREKLRTNVRQLTNLLGPLGFKPAEPGSDHAIPIFPIVIGENEKTLALAAALREKGFWITAIRPPTVPEGTARLRVTVMAGHTIEQLEGFAGALKECLGS